MESLGGGTYDLAVIGGGPAGASAAILAARYGARVLLLEKGNYPRQKVCGEFVSAESLHLLSSLLGDVSEVLEKAPRLSRARLFIQDKSLAVPVEPAAASIPRVDLDAALWKSALNAGVDARDNQTVQRISEITPLVISTDTHVFKARSVINASGRWSNLRRTGNRNTSPDTGKWLGVKAHFCEAQAANSVDLYFFKHGYCGVQPTGLNDETGATEINACAMVRADVATSLPEALGCHPELRKRSQSWRQITKTVTTSPLIFRTPEPICSGILQVGDAAGFVDPFVGDGISLALRSGALAAESLRPSIEGRVTLLDAGRSYAESYCRDLLPVFRASSGIRRLLEVPEPFRTGLIFVLHAVPPLARYLVRRTRQ